MSQEIDASNKFDKIERFQSLQAGHYWRATKSVVEQGIDEGTVLLIWSIKWVDDAPHTIVLRPHPEKFGKTVYLKIPKEDGSEREKWFQYSEHRFLLKHFLEAFEFEPDYQRIRNEELLRLQGRINDEQVQLLEAQRDPTILNAVVEEELGKIKAKQEQNSSAEKDNPVQSTLPAVQPQGPIALGTGAIAEAVGSGITAEGIESLKRAANQEHQIATIKAKWIQNKTAKIAETIKAMTPFYEEQAAAALAQTEDVQTYVAKLMKGIESLDLYVGKDVEVVAIKKGESAPSTEPLTIMQKKLMMDEELCVWEDVSENFDHLSAPKFIAALQEHQSLVDQIFTTPRCILVMATTRRFINYGDAWTNAARNRMNGEVFILVRDGMNIYQVFSPVESHLHTARLFPSKDDQDNLFRGYDGQQIKFEDIAYTDKLANHELYALHYKRFLLLMCGLDHRLKLFGDFYEEAQSLNFVSLAFQEKYCRFIHDDDGGGMMPRENRISVQKWIALKNAFLRSGSRVLCKWSNLMQPDNAPGAFSTYESGDYHQSYSPAEVIEIKIAYRSGDAICVGVDVNGRNHKWNEREFNCKVILKGGDRERELRSAALKNVRESSELAYLCLDDVSVADLHWYIHNRGERSDHVSYIRFFKAALKFLQEELAIESDTRNRMAQALVEGNILPSENVDEIRSIVHRAVMAWRAANRGKALPAFCKDEPPAEWGSILDQMYMLARTSQDQIIRVEQFIKAMGYEPLRLVLSGSAKLTVYAAPEEDERDDRIEPHCWVHKIVLKAGKNGISEKSRTWALLPRASASETTLHEWEIAAFDWRRIDSSIFASYEQKQRVFSTVMDFSKQASYYVNSMDPKTWFAEYTCWKENRKELVKKSKYVVNPMLSIPFGVIYYPQTKNLYYLCVSVKNFHALLYRRTSSDKFKELLHEEFIGLYANKTQAIKTFEKDIKELELFSLTSIPVSANKGYDEYKYASYRDRLKDHRKKSEKDPSIDHWLSNLKTLNANCMNSWIPDALLDSAGKTRFDDMLKIAIPEGYNPVSIYEFKLSKADTKYDHWFDIYPYGAVPDTEFLEGKCTGPIIMPSPEEARIYIKVEERHRYKVIESLEELEAEQPSEGIERWYMIWKL